MWFSETAAELATHQSEHGPAPSSQHPQGTTWVSCWNLHAVPQGHRSSLLSRSEGRPNVKGGGGGAVGLQVKGTVVECLPSLQPAGATPMALVTASVASITAKMLQFPSSPLWSSGWISIPGELWLRAPY